MIKLVDSLFGFINVRLHVMTQGCENKKKQSSCQLGCKPISISLQQRRAADVINPNPNPGHFETCLRSLLRTLLPL